MMDVQLILEPLELFIAQLGNLIPRVLGATLILCFGWVAAKLLRTLVMRLLRAIGLEKLSERAHLSEVLRRGEIRVTFVELLGQLAYWLIMVAAVMVAMQSVGIAAASEWLGRFGAFLPRIILSIALFLLGMLLASFLGTTVRVASLNAGFAQGHLVGQAVYTTVLLVTIIIALEQLQVVTRTIEVALYILMGTFGLAFALALGLGAQGFVKRFLEDLLWDKWKSSREK